MHQHIQAGQTMQRNSITPTATLQQLADNGDAQAQFELSYCYACGIEVESDMEQAMYWMQQSAEQGLAEAQLFLGIYYATDNDHILDFFYLF